MDEDDEDVDVGSLRHPEPFPRVPTSARSRPHLLGGGDYDHHHDHGHHDHVIMIMVIMVMVIMIIVIMVIMIISDMPTIDPTNIHLDWS